MDVALAVRWITAVVEAVHAHADDLCALDAAIGDGDHGTNLDRGFGAVRAGLDGRSPETLGELFVGVGRTLVSTVGGASGPLYGTAFRAVGKALPGPTATPAELHAALRAGLDALARLGGAAPGDKTIVDAYAPAVAAFGGAVREDPESLARAARAAAAAAADGARATTDLAARKGRASYLGERSVGHRDPGAVSTALIFQALADAVAG